MLYSFNGTCESWFDLTKIIESKNVCANHFNATDRQVIHMNNESAILMRRK